MAHCNWKNSLARLWGYLISWILMVFVHFHIQTCLFCKTRYIFFCYSTLGLERVDGLGALPADTPLFFCWVLCWLASLSVKLPLTAGLSISLCILPLPWYECTSVRWKATATNLYLQLYQTMYLFPSTVNLFLQQNECLLFGQISRNNSRCQIYWLKLAITLVWVVIGFNHWFTPNYYV